MSREEAEEFADARRIVAQRRDHNYNFLRKYLLYAKTIKPVYKPKAEELIKYFWVKLKLENIFNNRGFDTLYKMAEATARLKLSNVIDVEIVNDLIKSIKLMILQYGKVIEIPQDVRDVAVRLTVDYIKSLFPGTPITLQAALADIRKTNDQVNYYLGHKRFTLEENWKFREIKNRFLTYIKSDNEIHITSNKPLTLVYRNKTKLKSTNDVNDANEAKKGDEDKKNSEVLEGASVIIRNVSTSDTSHTRVTYPLKCYHCKVNGFTNQESYERHGIRFHRNVPLYPGYADLNALGLQPQGTGTQNRHHI